MNCFLSRTLTFDNKEQGKQVVFPSPFPAVTMGNILLWQTFFLHDTLSQIMSSVELYLLFFIYLFIPNILTAGKTGVIKNVNHLRTLHLQKHDIFLKNITGH